MPETDELSRISPEALEEMTAFEQRKSRISRRNLAETLYGAGRAGMGEAYQQGELHGGMSSAERFKQRRLAIEMLERLARIEQLYEAEGLKTTRLLIDTKARSARDLATLMVGKLRGNSTVTAALGAAKIKAADDADAEALEDMRRGGWALNNKRLALPANIGNLLGKYQVGNFRVLTRNGMRIHPDTAIQGKLFRDLASDLASIPDHANRAFFIQELSERSLIDFWALLAPPPSDAEQIAKGLPPVEMAPEFRVMGQLAGDAIAARSQMESVDLSARGRRENFNNLIRQAIPMMEEDPDMMENFLSIIDAGYSPETVITGWGTSSRPPASDAALATKQEYIQALTDGWMTVNDSGNVVYTAKGIENDPRATDQVFEWEQFVKRLPAKEKTAVQKATDHIEDFLADLAHGTTKTHEANRQNFYQQDIFQKFKESRFSGVAVDNEFVLDAFVEEASAQRDMNKEAAEKIHRENIISGKVASTPHQKRMAKFWRLFDPKEEEKREPSEGAKLMQGAQGPMEAAAGRTEGKPEKAAPKKQGWSLGAQRETKSKWDEFQARQKERDKEVAAIVEGSEWEDVAEHKRGDPSKAKKEVIPPTQKEARTEQKRRKRAARKRSRTREGRSSAKAAAVSGLLLEGWQKGKSGKEKVAAMDKAAALFLKPEKGKKMTKAKSLEKPE